jgi:hypothetical protein
MRARANPPSNGRWCLEAKPVRECCSCQFNCHDFTSLSSSRKPADQRDRSQRGACTRRVFRATTEKSQSNSTASSRRQPIGVAGYCAARVQSARCVVPSARQLDDKVVNDKHPFRRQPLVETHSIERDLFAASCTQGFDDRTAAPVVHTHPCGAKSDPESGADHLPGCFRIVERMARPSAGSWKRKLSSWPATGSRWPINA